MARIGVAIETKAFERMNMLRERLDISQAKLYEALLALPDDVIEKAVADFKAKSAPSKKELIEKLRKLSAEDLHKMLYASGLEGADDKGASL